METLNKYFTLRNFAAFLIVVFCIRYIPIDSRAGISYFKIAVSLLCPFVFLIYTPKINKTFFIICSYLLFVFSSAILHPNTLRWTTLVFLLSYFFMYQTFYNLVYERKVFTNESFTRFLEGFILSYFVLLVVQQIALIAGITYLPIINLTQFLDRGIGANSLSGEPSVSARILAVLFLALLRMYELKYARSLSFREIYREAKWPTIGFLWCMLTMGSGTAFVALGILSLYFIRRQFAFIIIPLLIVFYTLIPYIEFAPLQRAYSVFNAFLSFDYEKILRTDGSAATRVIPLLNTLTSLDLSQSTTWFGNGIDYSVNAGRYSTTVLIGGIGDYGLVSFIVIQILVFSCAINRFLSIETLIWIGLFNMTLGNVPYAWGAILVFTTVNYIISSYKKTL